MKDYEMFTDVKKAIVNVLNELNDVLDEEVKKADESEREETKKQTQFTKVFATNLMYSFIDELSMVNRKRVGDDEVERICEESEKENGEIDESLQDFQA